MSPRSIDSMSITQHLASRWVAGENIDAALRAAKRVNSEGAKALLNYLGEHYKNKAVVDQTVEMYIHLLDAIISRRVRADMSIKLTEIGLERGKGYCLENLLRIAKKSQEKNIGIWIDMEGPLYTQDSIDIYHDIFPHFSKVALTLQANLSRSRSDMVSILKKGGRIRLVKGAYKGDYTHADDIELNYSRLMNILFSSGNNFAIATNDEALIDEAKILASRYNKIFEFQFLRGVKKSLRLSLAKQFRVAEYTPFGKAVFPYMIRRVKEMV